MRPKVFVSRKMRDAGLNLVLEFCANGFEIQSQELITNDGFLVTGFNGKKSDVRHRTFVLTAAKKMRQQP